MLPNKSASGSQRDRTCHTYHHSISLLFLIHLLLRAGGYTIRVCQCSTTMFSLSSFLPAALQGNQEPKEVQPSPAAEKQEDELDAQKQSDNMGSVKKKGKKDKTANEVCYTKAVLCRTYVYNGGARHLYSFGLLQRNQITL